MSPTGKVKGKHMNDAPVRRKLTLAKSSLTPQFSFALVSHRIPPTSVAKCSARARDTTRLLSMSVLGCCVSEREVRTEGGGGGGRGEATTATRDECGVVCSLGNQLRVAEPRPSTQQGIQGSRCLSRLPTSSCRLVFCLTFSKQAGVPPGKRSFVGA